MAKKVKKIDNYGDIEKPKEKQKGFLHVLSNGWVSALLFLAGIYLLTPVMTGNIIGNLSLGFTNILGAVLIVLAIGGHYFLNKFLNSY